MGLELYAKMSLHLLLIIRYFYNDICIGASVHWQNFTLYGVVESSGPMHTYLGINIIDYNVGMHRIGL